MLRPKKKISRREIKQDQLVTTYFKAQNWFEEHRKVISSGTVALIVVLLAGWIYVNNQMRNEESAKAALGAILPYYDQDRWEVAINGVLQENIRGLSAIVSEYDGTPSGELAKFYLANAYYNLKNYDEASMYFEQADLDDPILVASAKAGEAACAEAKGNWQEAASMFEAASDLVTDEMFASEYLFDAATCYARAGNKDRSAELLKKLKKEYPTSTYARDAERLMVQVEAQPS